MPEAAWRHRSGEYSSVAKEIHGSMAKTKRAAAAKAGAEKRAPSSIRAKAQKTVVKEIRKKVEEKLSESVEKASLADYIKLVQLEKELTKKEPKETKATWVDPKEMEGSEGSESGK